MPKRTIINPAWEAAQFEERLIGCPEIEALNETIAYPRRWATAEDAWTKSSIPPFIEIDDDIHEGSM